jgi:hypothetical protein
MNTTKTIGKPSGMTCPVTGSELLHAGHDEGVLDGCHYYVSSSDNNVFFSRHPFQWNIFRLDPERPFDVIHVYTPDGKMSEADYKVAYERAKPVSESLKLHGKYTRYFRLEDDGRWTALVHVANKYIPAETPIEEIVRLIEEYDAEYERRKAEYLANPESGPFIFRVVSTGIATELVNVKPMSPPTGLLAYIDVFTKQKSEDL